MNQVKNERANQLVEVELVYEKSGSFWTNSQIVAEIFEKQHKNVLRDISNLECSPEFNELNFEPVTYTDKKGELRPMYLMSKDGFSLLAMGFTGKKATQFKEAFINKFNEMEKTIKQQQKVFSTPTNYIEALKQLAQTLEEKEKTEKEKLQLVEEKTQLQEEKKQLIPKATLFDILVETTDLKSLRQIGYKLKRFGLGPNSIFDFLRKHNVITKSCGENYPTHKYEKHFKIETVKREWIDKNTGLVRSKAFDILKVQPSFYQILAVLCIQEKIIKFEQWLELDFSDVPQDEAC